MSERDKRKTEWRTQSLARKDQLELERSLQKILRLEQRSAEQLALLNQHKDLAAQISNSIEASNQRKRMKAEHEDEVEDAPELLETKLCQLADIIRISDRVVFHTGAGLSTAAGIPDFRGPQGVWTLQKKGQVAGMNMRYEEARPTQAHMAIGEMVRRGLVSHVVTQNVDGLLLRAGVPPDLLSELHGCVYTERCPSCGSSYLRGFDVTATNGTSFRRHSTGRTCDEVAQPGSATSEPTEVASEGSRALDDGKSALDGSSYERNRDEKEEVRGDGDYRRARLSEEPEEPAEAAAHTFEDSGVDRAGEHAEPGSGTPFLEEAAGFLVTAPATDATGAGGNDENEREFRKRERGCKPAPRESTPRHCLEERSVEKERGDRETAGGSKVNRCGSELRDTIVHFGERLDEETLRTAREASKGADLAVVLGTSLKVPPASTLPGLAKTVVIINLQWTAKDKKAALKINGRCEDVMGRLCRLLDIAVPEYDLRNDPILCGRQDREAPLSGALKSKSCDVEGGAVAKGARLKAGIARQRKSRARAAFPRPVL